jgi:RluA family pseudouridine synthase
MKNEKLPVIYEDENLLVIDKPAGINSDDIEKRVHRLDKDTSGVLLVAKKDSVLEFLQKQFKENQVKKKYILLIVGKLKAKKGEIRTFFARGGKDRRKQKVFSPLEPNVDGKKLRLAITDYQVIKEFKKYTLVEAFPKTGRRHQIRAHFAYLGHPLAGDNLYGFKKQLCPKGLKRQFLHASYLKIKLPDGRVKEFTSKLPENFKNILKNL